MENLYKAKRLDNGEWVEGNLLLSEDAEKDFRAIIVPVRGSNMFTDRDDKDLGIEVWYQVDPDTICRYTGREDRNGRKVWENDILKIAEVVDCAGRFFNPPVAFPNMVFVRWDYCAWIWEMIGPVKRYFSFPDAWCHYESEVIGNTMDNPELLEVEENNGSK